MPYRYSPLGNFIQFVLCLALCEALTRPRVYYPPGPVIYANSEAPDPAPLPALVLEVPPKAEVLERV